MGAKQTRRKVVRVMAIGGAAVWVGAGRALAQGTAAPPPAAGVKVLALADLAKANAGVPFRLDNVSGLLLAVPEPPSGAALPPHVLRVAAPAPTDASAPKAPDTLLAAYDRSCTHLRCPVDVNVAERVLYCGCHGSEFFATGDVKSGPAGRPLAAVKLELRDGDVWAVGLA